ncbi:MAG: TlpA family protein disulfide reductase [Bryobacteraceae bacterium]
MKIETGLKLGIAACLALLAYGVVSALRAPVVNVNDKAPDFTVTTDSGRTISRSDFGGRLLVLNFWATWCPPCVEELPSLDRFQRQLAGSGVVVLGISVDQDAGAYRRFLERARVSFLTARDPEARISSRYGTFKFPETFLIDRRGRVREKIIGPADWTEPAMIERVRRLLEES